MTPPRASGCTPASTAAAVAPGVRLEGPREPVTLEVVIPAYNEERRLPQSLGVLCDYLDRQPFSSSVVVVDNGSVDRTPDIVSGWPRGRVAVHLVGCATRGKGAAVRRGVLTSSAEWVGFMDADLATPVETLDRVIPLLRQGRPIVVASRRCAGARYQAAQPLSRRLCGWGFRRLARSIVHDVHDTQCGFKFFHGEVAHSLFSAGRTTGFVFDLEVLAIARQWGWEVVEVPVTWTSRDGSTLGLRTHGREVAADLASIRRASRMAGRRQAGTLPVHGTVAG